MFFATKKDRIITADPYSFGEAAVFLMMTQLGHVLIAKLQSINYVNKIRLSWIDLISCL
jgi:hypothetical protein